MHVLEETPELYRTMARFRAVAHELARQGYGDRRVEEDESAVQRWRRWIRRALAVVREHGAAAEAASGRHRLRQVFDLVHLQRSLAIDTHYYYRFHLYRRDRCARAALFVPEWQMQTFTKRVRAHLDPAVRATVDDKACFREHCRRHGLPSIPTIAVFDGGQVEWREGNEALPAADLFAKPVDALGGEGAMAWRFDGGCYLRPDGTAQTGAEVLDGLCRASRGTRYVLQPRVCNHAELGRIAGEGLVSVRVTTSYRDGTAEARAAFCLLPAGGSVVSNVSAGGLTAAVALDDGTLGAAGFKLAPFRPLAAHHPDTGARIEGERLSDWDALLALVERAHETLPDVPMIGWDVALTPDGPCLIEGNLIFGVESFQALGRPPLALTGIPQSALDHYDRLSAHARR